MKFTWVSLKHVRFGVGFGLLLFLGMAVPVLAQSENEPSNSPIPTAEDQIPTLAPGAELRPRIVLPTAEDMAATTEEIGRAVSEEQAALEAPAAVQERGASLHAYEDLSPAEAEQLLMTKFADVLASLNNDPSRYLSDATLERPLGDTAAQVTSDGKTSVMEGVLPVRVENAEGDLSKVDLGLEETGEGLVPANPLVDVTIASSAEEGVEVGDEGLRISQAGADDSTARPLGDKNVFFGEVEEGTDTDLLVSPISGGVELFNMLRSVDSPETLRFHMDMPQGAELRPTPSGGAEVAGEDGSMLAEVAAPRAVDAQGRLVPVTLAVDGDALVLSLNHREEEVAYPLLVDPEVIDNWHYSFYNNQSLGTLSAWGYQESQNGWLHHGTSDTSWPGHGGLFFASQPGNLPGGQWGQYLFSAPNATSYFEKGVLVPFWRNNRTCSAPNPYPEPYDFDGMWYQGHWNESAVNLPDINQANQLGYADLSWGQTVIFGMSTSSGIDIPCWRDLGMMGLQLWLNDWNYPYVNSVSGVPSGWVKKGTNFTINAEGSDEGLGVQRIRAFGVGTPEWNWNQPSCAGTFESPCANNRSGQITIATSGFPYEGRYNSEGKERKFSVQAIDPTDKRWALERALWLDGAPPVVSLKGQLATITKQVGSEEKSQGEGNDELSLPTYKLEIEASDGSDRSGVKEIKVFLDSKTTPEEVKPGSCGTNCPQALAMNYTLRLPDLAPGGHSLRIVAVDKVGNESDPNRNIEFEYIPATGMKEEHVLQHFRLPDGNDYSGEAEYHGTEIAVNVMNGNVVFHERDIDVETDRAELELERVYNSQQPTQEDTQWGRGWSIAQAPKLEPQPGPTPPQKATVTQTGRITNSVPIPQAQSQTIFSSRLHANITKTAAGYEVEPTSEPEVSVFNDSGRVEEVVLGDNTPVYLEPEEAEPVPPAPPTYASSFGANGSGSGQFKSPADAAVDATGNVWVADRLNNRIQKFSSSGEYLSQFGAFGSGNGQLSAPTALAVDTQGNIWVADGGNRRVQKFNSKGEFLLKFGSQGSGNGQFSSYGPRGIAVDTQGNIWVSDYSNRVQKFNAAGEFVKVVGSGLFGESAGLDAGQGKVWVGDWAKNQVRVFSEAGDHLFNVGSQGTGPGQFNRPDAVEVDAKGSVWIGDEGNSRVQQLNQQGEYVTQFGAAGSGDGQFSFGWPFGLTSDNLGRIWIADSNNHRVQRWQIANWAPTYASSFGANGSGSGQFKSPADAAVDATGNVWVADRLNNRIQKFSSSGEYLSQFGAFGSGNGQLSAPTALAVDTQGNIWVADGGNRRVQKFNSKGEFLLKFGSQGSGNGQFSSYGPRGIAVDTQGNIWVSDYSNRVQKFNAAGEFVKVVGSGLFGESAGLDAGQGKVWVGDWAKNQVRVFSEAGDHLFNVGSQGTGPGQFNRPDAVEVDAKGSVWIGDEGNSRVQQLNQQGEYVTQFGAAGSGDGQFSFGWPFGLTSDNLGRIWIADSNNHRVQRWSSTDSIGGAIGGSGPAPYFAAPVVDYEYAEGKLTGLQLEDEATQEEDPSLDMSLASGLVSGVDSEEAGDTAYSYESGKLKAVDGEDGETKYGHDSSGRLNSVTLPNGTVATITYDTTSRATSVKVDPAGPETAKTTSFSYSTEPRRTIVWGGGNPEITYDIGEDGSVLKWAYAETPPTIASISGSLWSKKGEEIENKDHTLFVTGSSAHQVASIKVIANGNAVVAETTCEDPAEPPSHICDQPAPLEWITNAAEHPAGRMDLEVIVTDFLGHETAERFFVIVPQQPPPDPTVAERPNFNSIRLFREEHGLDRNKSLTGPQLNELILELLYEWENRNETTMTAVESWGVPMRAPELAEMDWRREYLAQASEAIPDWVEEYASSTYGGYYVDNRAGGTIYVGFTQDQHSQVEALKQSGVLMAPEQVQEMPTPPTRAIASVEVTEASVAAFVEGNPTASNATTSISTVSETGMIEVTATNPSLVQEMLVAQFGATAPINVVPDLYPLKSTHSRYHVTGPVYAGDAIQSEYHSCQDGICQFAECTANYGARDQVGHVRGDPVYAWFKLTAGHCFAFNEGVRRRSNRNPDQGEIRSVGRVKRTGWNSPNSSGNFTDGEAIDVNAPLASSGLFYGNPSSIWPIDGMQRMRVRRLYCWSGRYGGTNCGVAFRVRRYKQDGVKWTIGMDIMGPTIAGDSGGPVWDPRTLKAVGVISAHGAINGKPCTKVKEREWCPRTLVAPLLPFHGKSYPDGVIPRLGVELVRNR